jgi:hypothetical protein
VPFSFASARLNALQAAVRHPHSNMDIVELIIDHVLTAYNYALIEGWDNIKLIKKVICKLGLVSIFLSDEVISGYTRCAWAGGTTEFSRIIDRTDANFNSESYLQKNKSHNRILESQ